MNQGPHSLPPETFPTPPHPQPSPDPMVDHSPGSPTTDWREALLSSETPVPTPPHKPPTPATQPWSHPHHLAWSFVSSACESGPFRRRLWTSGLSKNILGLASSTPQTSQLLTPEKRNPVMPGWPGKKTTQSHRLCSIHFQGFHTPPPIDPSGP